MGILSIGQQSPRRVAGNIDDQQAVGQRIQFAYSVGQIGNEYVFQNIETDHGIHPLPLVNLSGRFVTIDLAQPKILSGRKRAIKSAGLIITSTASVVQ